MITRMSGSPLFEMARRGKRLPHLVVAVIVLLIALVVIFASTELLVVGLFGGGTEVEQAYYDGAWFLVLPFSLLLVLLWVWVRVYEKRPLSTVGLPSKGALKRFGVGMLAGFGMIVIVVGIMATLGLVSVDAEGGRVTGMSALGSVALFLFAYMIQSGTEEILFRGWILQTATVRHSLVVGLVANILLFALFHFPKNPVAGVMLVLFGVFTSLYAIREGSVWGVCGWHAAWNWSQSKLFGLPLSGHEVPSGTIVNLKTQGAGWLTGGDFGPEGSVIAIVVVLAGCVWLWRGVKPGYSFAPPVGEQTDNLIMPNE